MKRSSKSLIKTKREKLRFGLVGAGAIAQSYLRAFEWCPEAELVAVADCRIDAAQQLAQQAGCRSFDHYGRMIEEMAIDAAIVCTPPASHPEISIGLMENGIHVLCEKPFSIDSDAALRMIDVSQAMGVKLTMASKFRYVEDITRARSMAAAGALGDLVLFENVFANRVDMSSRWNAIASISGGGVLIDNGTHSVDLMRYFLGPLAEVHALEGKRSQGLNVEETVSLFVRSVSGVIGNIDLSWSITKQRESFVDIYGTRGAISVGWTKSSYLDFSHGKWTTFGSGYNKVEAFRRQIENFARAIRGEESLLIGPEDALASVRIIESAYKALHQNQWIPVSNLPNQPEFRTNIN